MIFSTKTPIAQWALPLGLLITFAAPSMVLAQTSPKQESPKHESRESIKVSASRHVNDAVSAVRRMEAEPAMQPVMQAARGVYIVPTYGRAALGVGGQGGAGVLLVRQGNQWTDPAFYNIGGISVGAQVGLEGGPVAFVLKNDKAVQRFTDKNNFSLSADAGLTVINWARIAQGSTGEGDVVAWSGTKGLFGNVATLSVNDIRFNSRLTNAYYGKTTSAMDVINGKASSPESDELKQALASASAGAATGKSGGGTEVAPQQK